MSRYKIAIVALFTFTVGVMIDSGLRRPESGITNCFGCGSLRCKIVLVADHPVISISHPLETVNLFLND